MTTKMSTNEYMYDTGWNSAVGYIARLLRLEAEACIKDIVPGDEIGRRDANARAGALLTAEIDVKALVSVGPRGDDETPRDA